MHATIRRYEGVDATRTDELTGKVKETLVPELRKLPGFAGYYLIDAGAGVFSSLGLFDSPEQAQAWYDSPAYQAILPLRLRNATTRVLLAAGT